VESDAARNYAAPASGAKKKLRTWRHKLEHQSDGAFEGFCFDLQMGVPQSEVYFKQEPPDAMDDFIEEDQLRKSGATGRAAQLSHVVRLRSEQPPPDEPQPEQLNKRGRWEDDLKKKNGGSHREIMLKRWLAEKLALGERIEDLVAHARRHDLATGNLLAQLGAELLAA